MRVLVLYVLAVVKDIHVVAIGPRATLMAVANAMDLQAIRIFNQESFCD